MQRLLALLALVLVPPAPLHAQAGDDQGPADPRQELVRLQLEGRFYQALERTRQLLAEREAEAEEMGLPYLHGHLLDRLGRHEEAGAVFADAMGRHPRLSLHARYRAALEQEETGHPEVAAGLVASVVSSRSAPRRLQDRAVELLVRTLEKGGDCRLIQGMSRNHLSRHSALHLRLAEADCLRRSLRRRGPGTSGEALRRARREAVGIYRDLLDDDLDGEIQRLAAERLADLVPPRSAPVDPDSPHRSLAARIGLAFHQHRSFDRALTYLSRASSVFDGAPLDEDDFRIAYARVRSLFWQERYGEAAEGYGLLAARSPAGERRAQAFYQQGRCLELAGHWRQAFASFQGAYRTEPDGEWADRALLAMVRLLWTRGQETPALKIYQHLTTERSWRHNAARGALFLASTDLVRGRAERAGPWLERAARVPDYRLEASYWRGRLAELEGDLDAALDRYLGVLEEDYFHPLARGVRRRLAGERLAGTARDRGLRAAGSRDPGTLYRAWLLLGPDDPRGRTALETARGLLLVHRTTGPFLQLTPLPVERWPLWQTPLHRPDDLLLALGVWDQTAHLVDEHFPLSDLQLGFTGSNVLAQAEEVRESIRLAEILSQRIPDRLPEPLWLGSFRRLLHPLAHRQLLVREGQRFGVDPLLLAAVIREESRFDPRALSAASARGLTQFVRPTAERLAPRLGLGSVTPEDLYRPPVAIALGAAYLRELLDRFHGARHVAVASYNAGEPQAELWRSYCASAEPEEYFTKVGFNQTRNYLAKVLGSYQTYGDLYALETEQETLAGAQPPIPHP